jgi:hypothetical protein
VAFWVLLVRGDVFGDGLAADLGGFISGPNALRYVVYDGWGGWRCGVKTQVWFKGDLLVVYGTCGCWPKWYVRTCAGGVFVVLFLWVG